MNKAGKILLIVAAVLVLLGALLFLISAASVGMDFTKLGTGSYQENSYSVTEGFTDICIKTDTADIVFLPSYDEECRVICYEREKEKHTVAVVDGVLTVFATDTRKWYEKINFDFVSPKLTVYLPQSGCPSLTVEESTGDIDIAKELTFKEIDISLSTGDVVCRASVEKDIKITASTGNIFVEGVTAASFSSTTSTGDVSLSGATFTGDVTAEISTGVVHLADVTCGSLISEGSSGRVRLESVIADERIELKRNSGDVALEGVDAAELFIKTSSGDVKGTILSDKVFLVETGSGDIDVPRTVTGGRCEITTSSGDVEIAIP